MQPAKQLLREQGYAVSGIARRYGLSRANLENVLVGRSTPTPDVCRALTDCLDMPITEIFPAEVVARVYSPAGRRHA